MAKTITFAVMHFTIAFTVAYLITGSFIVGGLVAIVEPAINTVAFYFHEIIWNKLSQRKLKEAVTAPFVSLSESYALKSM